MIGKGLKTSAIALQLHLSPKTVQVYRESIKKKMSLSGTVELHQIAFQWVHEQQMD
jgi:DNA-binding NarL/FixJ family response regulator